MTLAASESQLSLWSLGSAPFILGGDLSNSVVNAYGISAGITSRGYRLLTNKKVIAVDQDGIDASRVADVGTPGSSHGDQVFAKVEQGGDAIVGLFNTTTKLASSPVSIATTAAAIGLPADPDGYLVRDLWGGQSVVGGGTEFQAPAPTPAVSSPMLSSILESETLYAPASRWTDHRRVPIFGG